MFVCNGHIQRILTQNTTLVNMSIFLDRLEIDAWHVRTTYAIMHSNSCFILKNDSSTVGKLVICFSCHIFTFMLVISSFPCVLDSVLDTFSNFHFGHLHITILGNKLSVNTHNFDISYSIGLLIYNLE